MRYIEVTVGLSGFCWILQAYCAAAEDVTMSKSKDTKKESKKQPLLNAKEKKAKKKEKSASSSSVTTSNVF